MNGISLSIGIRQDVEDF